MQAFSAKGTGETLTLTVAFSANVSSDAVIVSAAVTAEVYDASPVLDDNPSAILDGDPQINGDPFTVRWRPVLPYQAIMQSVTGGIVGAVYVLTFKATLSTGEVLIEQGTLAITKYVPTP
jgi:hypothetical protein